MVPAGARAATNDAAPWTLSQDGSDRSCPLTLHFDAAGAAGVLAAPAGCRRALPAIVAARRWSFGDDGAIELRDAAGQSLLVFTRRDDGIWYSEDGTGLSYSLRPPHTAPADTTDAASSGDEAGAVALASPTDMAVAAADATPRSAVHTAAATAVDANASATPVTGRYAVMRGDRDTGCMVTLEGTGKAKSRARLAPACRDQGITIFDPISWQSKNSKLVLTARKGHSIDLERGQDGVWVKMPKDAKALGLKPL